jgi:SAM-dependent methyltransferase
MADADSREFGEHRVVRWLRALRGIARTGRAVEAQGHAQQELRRALSTLERSHADLRVQDGANLEHVRHELAYLTARFGEALAAQERQLESLGQIMSAQQGLAESQQRLSSALADLAQAQRQSEMREIEAARAASTIPRLARAGDTDSATWISAAFEETFRGTRAQVRERLASYVEDARAAHAAIGGPAVDIGCGRGEWLELMGEAGIPVRGVDENAMIIEQCRELALDAVRDDAVAYLAGVPQKTLSVVSAFHVLEHLPQPKQLQVLAAAYNALAPGGILILETPNPENLIVGAWTFYMDPSHLRPMPPTLLGFLVEAAGFEVAGVRRLHPDDGLAARAEREQWPAGLRELICGPRDVGIVARRPVA